MEKLEEKRGKSWQRDRDQVRGRRTLSGRVGGVGGGTTNRSVIGSGGGGLGKNVTDSDSSSRRGSTGDESEKVAIQNVSSNVPIPTESQVTSETDSQTTNEMEKPTVEDVVDENAEELKFLDKVIGEIQEKLSVRSEQRTANRNAISNYPDESFFTKLDSNLRKNTAFVKKIRNVTEAQRDSLIKDMNCLNLTRYIGEVACAIVEAKLKMSDIGAAVHICSLLHQRYADFSTILLENWQKALSFKKDEKISNPSKLRVDLRFYAELISCGVFSNKDGLPLLGNLLMTLINMDKEDHNNLTIVLSFCKHCGDDYAGLVSHKIRVLAAKHDKEIPRSQLLTPEKQKNVRSLLKDYYASLCKHLLKCHKELQMLDRQNCRILQTKGELSSERQNKFETSRLAYEKLYVNTQQFSDTLDEAMPELPKDELSKSEGSGGCIDVHHFKSSEFHFEGDTSIWEDEDMRSFYENLPDLKAFIPGILFKDSVRSATPSNVEKSTDEVTELEEAEISEKTTESETVDVKIEIEDKKVDLALKESELVSPEVEDVEEEPEVPGTTCTRILLDAFLTSLPHCVNRELIDKAAVEFCMSLNTKPNRKKLVKTVFLVPRTRLDLLPFYSRFVATLNPCMPDVAIDLAAMLKQDFRHHVLKKDQINIESKVKTVRFIGELVKFKMYAKAEALYCLKILLSDFSHHHIEMTCNLLETCGRFLFRQAESHQRTKVYLEQMMRKKTVMPFDSRYITMIENAFYYCNPPEAQLSVKKERPPMYEYIRKLLFKDLCKNNIEKVLRQIRKLNWEDKNISFYTTKCLTAIWNVKYYNIRCVANLLAGLVATKENIGLHVVDGVLEDIRLGMEINLAKYNQRRVSSVRYLGELYNYRMVESSVIFKILYLFITFGVAYDGSVCELDPPENLFRIRMICILLDTCGQYFNSGSSKKKFDCFMTYFQRYYWLKRSNEVWNEENLFPVTVDFMLKDTIAALRPKFQLCESYEEAQKAVEDLEEELHKKLAEALPLLNEAESQSDGLETVHETDEDEDNQSTAASDNEVDDDVIADSQSQPNEGEDVDNDGHYITGDSSQPADGENDGYSQGKPRLLVCAEDEDFMTAFDKMIAENIQHRSQEQIKAPQIEIAVPVNIKITFQKYDSEGNVEERNTVNFILMTRRGNKHQYKNLEVPVSSELALNLKDREEAERAEKEHVKKLTLEINERQEEEDYQEMLAAQQRPTMLNLNRERRQKYQHPKGAPDADLIFGNKLLLNFRSFSVPSKCVEHLSRVIAIHEEELTV